MGVRTQVQNQVHSSTQAQFPYFSQFSELSHFPGDNQTWSQQWTITRTKRHTPNGVNCQVLSVNVKGQRENVDVANPFSVLTKSVSFPDCSMRCVSMLSDMKDLGLGGQGVQLLQLQHQQQQQCQDRGGPQHTSGYSEHRQGSGQQ